MEEENTGAVSREKRTNLICAPRDVSHRPRKFSQCDVVVLEYLAHAQVAILDCSSDRRHPDLLAQIKMSVISDTSVNALSSSGVESQRINNDFTHTPAKAAVKALQEAGLGDVVYLPGEDHFESRIASYWSRTSQLKPWAIAQPRDAQEVSAALKALVDTPGCQLAIRSGGHMAAPGASSIEAGVTIDLGLLNTTVYNAETNVASLGPSARWGDVYAELEKRE